MTFKNRDFIESIVPDASLGGKAACTWATHVPLFGMDTSAFALCVLIFPANGFGRWISATVPSTI
jgi:hypothetical protein